MLHEGWGFLVCLVRTETIPRPICPLGTAFSNPCSSFSWPWVCTGVMITQENFPRLPGVRSVQCLLPGALSWEPQLPCCPLSLSVVSSTQGVLGPLPVFPATCTRARRLSRKWAETCTGLMSFVPSQRSLSFRACCIVSWISFHVFCLWDFFGGCFKCQGKSGPYHILARSRNSWW